MPVTYQESRDLSAEQLGELFLSVGWTAGKYPEKLKPAMANSNSVITAWDGDKLIGLINCLSDGVLTAYIHYLLVHPDYQGKGIGRTLLQMMMSRYSHCLRKVLICDDAQAGFYERCGYVAGRGTMAMFCDNDPEPTTDVT